MPDVLGQAKWDLCTPLWQGSIKSGAIRYKCPVLGTSVKEDEKKGGAWQNHLGKDSGVLKMISELVSF